MALHDEDLYNLPEEAKDFHRMIVTVMEELEAVDWYNQRAAATKDPQVRAIVEHNRDEEFEHAAMALEWLRRHHSVFDQYLKEFLFSDGHITHADDEHHHGHDHKHGPIDNPQISSTSSDNSLGIKGLNRKGEN
ncbi:encapsulin-associated ferritin-like protein [Orenia marismortui]|uniref:Ferritin n=1 Tax=Orenia marismortui TaxID=46469 RepID=A0A4R8GPW0_9FIRM|nr:encapsulin-associated ferritin-like protein [Orenia marismortui]TDX47815.1 hypothetical protein C7959_1354 [Orenia marismortui]